MHAEIEAIDAARPATAREVHDPSPRVERGLTTGKAPADQILSRIKNKGRQRLIVRAVTIAGDLVAISAAFLLANFIWLGNPLHVHALNLLQVVLPIYFVAAANIGAYAVESSMRLGVGVVKALGAFLFTLCSIALIIFMLRMGTDFSRAVFMMGSLGSFISIPFVRILMRKPVSSILNGSASSTLVIVDGIDYEPQDEHEIVVTPEQLHFHPETSDPIRFHWLAQSVAELDRVIVGCQKERYATWSSVLKGMGIDGEILTDEDDRVGIIGIGRHGSHRTMIVAAGPLHFRQRVLKRMLDFALSSMALVFLSPLLLAVALIIRLESKGPVLFVQERIGRHNRIFRLYKFRSMYTEQCDVDAAQLTTRNDPRVTRVGDIIRRTSIDELPQLLNVLKGEMSLVGPRPHAMSAKAADVLYWDVDPRYRHRHSMKPGLTGLAQVRGFRGATERQEDLVNRLTSDLEYVAHWSIMNDLRIIIRTLKVLRHDTAY